MSTGGKDGRAAVGRSSWANVCLGEETAGGGKGGSTSLVPCCADCLTDPGSRAIDNDGRNSFWSWAGFDPAAASDVAAVPQNKRPSPKRFRCFLSSRPKANANAGAAASDSGCGAAALATASASGWGGGGAASSIALPAAASDRCENKELPAETCTLARI